jgi:non-ribosomal peptide synthase protein (TIGR01720 family)
VEALQERGAEVLVMEADVSDEEQMGEVVRRSTEAFGQIHGVIHSAGLPPAGLIQLKTQEMAARVLSPKVKGALVLDRVLKDTRLDFMIFNSSLRSYMGLPGGIDYTAANAFLDAFAHYRTMAQPDQLTVSINWDGWEETGMAVESAGRSIAVEREQGTEEILSREGVEVFSRILGTSLSQVIVSVQDFEKRLAQHNARGATDHLALLKREHQARTAHPRPSLETSYVAPRNDVEQLIAGIWQDLLGIERVGVHDNFFELGGDSVISLQITAKVNQAGLRLTPRLVFEHQTIDSLARAVGTTDSAQAEQGLIVGPLPLTPIQQWFFERDLPEPHHFNQALLLEVREALAPAILEQSLRYLIIHHDALRLRFVRGERGWQQMNADFDGGSPFYATDLSSLSEDKQRLAIETATAATQASLNLSEGPLVRVLLFDLGPQRPRRLLIVSHHLAVDGVSWRILLEDLQTIYRQLSLGETVTLAPKTTSFKHWAERLAEYAQSAELQDELIYWSEESRRWAGRLAVDFPLGVNTEASARTVAVSLSAEETRALLQEVPAAYRTQINDVLLTALAQALSLSTGEHGLIVDLEGHGREAIFETVDVSRTVGWFTTIFPVLLKLEKTAGPGEALREIKEQLRAVPNHGMGYGALRYLGGEREVAERLAVFPNADVSFLYLGQLDQTMSQVEMFGAAPESSGPTCSPLGTRSHLLEVTAVIVGGRLKLDWGYSENLHERSAIEHLAGNFIEALRAIIHHCQSPEAGGYTPSDFVEAGLSQDDLDELMAQLSTSEEMS